MFSFISILGERSLCALGVGFGSGLLRKSIGNSRYGLFIGIFIGEEMGVLCGLLRREFRLFFKGFGVILSSFWSS